LYLAAHFGDEEAVKLLLSRPDIEVDVKDEHNVNELSWAALWGQVETVGLLLDRPEYRINEVFTYRNRAQNLLSLAIETFQKSQE